MEPSLMEGDYIGPVQDFIGKVVGGFVHVHRAGEEDVPADGDFRRIGVAVVEFRPKAGIVEADYRIFFLFQHRNELGKVVLCPGQVHFIKADEEHFIGMGGSIDEELRQSRIGTAVHHVLHVHIAQNVAIVHPGRAYGQETDPAFRQSQGPAVEAYQSRFPGAAHAGQNGEAGGFQGNMEIDEVILVIEKA